MTICIAALCENGDSCVVAADRMAVFGAGSVLEFKQDDNSHKIYKLDERSVLLHSGATQDAEAIVERLRTHLGDGTTNDRLQSVLVTLLREKRDRQISLAIGGDFNYEKLIAAITAAPIGPFQDVWDVVRKMDVGDMLLATSLESKYAIYWMRPPAFTARSDLHYAAVGSGGIYARAALTIQQYAKSCDLTEALFQVYSAKKAAEIVYGVGEPTDMAVLTRYGFKEVCDETMDRLESIRTDREQFVLTAEQRSTLKASLGIA